MHESPRAAEEAQGLWFSVCPPDLNLLAGRVFNPGESPVRWWSQRSLSEMNFRFIFGFWRNPLPTQRNDGNCFKDLSKAWLLTVQTWNSIIHSWSGRDINFESICFKTWDLRCDQILRKILTQHDWFSNGNRNTYSATTKNAWTVF